MDVSAMAKAKGPKSKEERRRQSPVNEERDRRTQSRRDGILADIEDATYTVLRRHEKKSPSSSRRPR
jgi:hypothetical protein